MGALQTTFDPPVGRIPTLQFVPPHELQVDATYQRSIEGGDSQALIKRIAKTWNWGLCQPLVVSRRRDGDDEELFVIDGQHRLEAAKLRGDIAQLPCVIAAYRSSADEAADFVQINRQRRPLTRLEVFRAAVASGDDEAVSILAAMRDAGLSLAPGSNYTSWKPGMVANIAGIEKAWRRHGSASTKLALVVLGRAWPGEILQYAGTIFPGIAAICAAEVAERWPSDTRLAKLTAMFTRKPQVTWRIEIERHRIDRALAVETASAQVLERAWSKHSDLPLEPVAPPAPSPQAVIATPPAALPASVRSATIIRGLVSAFDPDGVGDGKAWCAQCDVRVSRGRAKVCTSPFCKVRGQA